MDDVIISAGTVVDALRGFIHGATAQVPVVHQDAGDYTVYYLSMDGPLGTSIFPCDIKNKVMSNVAYTGQSGLYIYSAQGVTGSIPWVTQFTGYCGGHAITSPSAGNSAGYIFGYKSGAAWLSTSVTDLTGGLTAAKELKKSLTDNTFRFYLGLGMTGNSGSAGAFTNLYAAGFTNPFSYYPLEANLNYLKILYDGIIVNGASASVSIADTDGVFYSFATGPQVGLYRDVLNTYCSANRDRIGINNAIQSKSSFAALNQGIGFTAPSILSKVAKTGYLVAAVSKTNIVSKSGSTNEVASAEPEGL
jgi:hypothetical protein